MRTRCASTCPRARGRWCPSCSPRPRARLMPRWWPSSSRSTSRSWAGTAACSTASPRCWRRWKPLARAGASSPTRPNTWPATGSPDWAGRTAALCRSAATPRPSATRTTCRCWTPRAPSVSLRPTASTSATTNATCWLPREPACPRSRCCGATASTATTRSPGRPTVSPPVRTSWSNRPPGRAADSRLLPAPPACGPRARRRISMSTPTALDSFLDKWRQRWPEWAVAEVFVPQEGRDRVVAWFALLQEFDDILNTAGDPLPADAKLGWWATELSDWAGQRSRHPLGRILQPVPAPWERLAAALPDLVAARARAADQQAAVVALERYATAVAEVEAGELDGRAAQPRQLATQVLAQRLSDVGQAAVPLSLLDGEGGTAAVEVAQRDGARALLDGLPARIAGLAPRRIWAALARGRLRPQAAGKRVAASPVGILWTARRAARG